MERPNSAKSISASKLEPLAPMANRGNIWITGSVARGTATAGSDIDIIVELTEDQFEDVAVARCIEDEVLGLTSDAEVYFSRGGDRTEVWQLSRPNRDGLIGAPYGLWTDAKPIRSFFPLGTCYEDAWRFLIKQDEGFLIHGSVQLSSGAPRINHAWVELPTGWVREPQTGQYYTIEDFQTMSPVEEFRYTGEEVAIMVARTGNMGPWTDEEREEYLRRTT